MLTISQLLIIVGLLAILSELFIGIQTGFDLVLIGSILVLSGFIGTVTNLVVALTIAVILSLVYLLYGRTFIRSKLQILTTRKTNIDRLIGQTAIVVRTITPHAAGMIKLGDEDWRADSDETLYEKDKVKVISIEGVTLKVEKI